MLDPALAKLAIISDIHGNRLALEVVLEDIYKRNIKSTINLGDSIYGPLWPEETAQLLRKPKNIIHILGNEDEILFNHPLKNSTGEFVLNKISSETLDWIKSMPRIYRLENSFIAFHGTARSSHEYLVEKVTGVKGKEIIIKSEEELNVEVESIAENLILCGHSHTSHIIRLANGKFIINPGSVGLPAYDDDMPFFHKVENYSPHARYLIIKSDGIDFNFEMRVLNYDYESASDQAKKNKRDDWAYWLLTGRAELGSR